MKSLIPVYVKVMVFLNLRMFMLHSGCARTIQATN
jgi:hypothetical protein